MPHTLAPLPYPSDALEPYLDARTLEIHHDKHHAAYVSNLNKALEGHPELQSLSLTSLLADLDRVPETIRTAVRNHGGGHFAHTMYWETLGREGGGEPRGGLAAAIRTEFGSFAELRARLSQSAASHFASGWAWLYLEKGRLAVRSTPGHDGPEMSGGIPLLVIDVWEHAYYLKYQNRRAEYIEAWWNLVRWDKVAESYERAAR